MSNDYEARIAAERAANKAFVESANVKFKAVAEIMGAECELFQDIDGGFFNDCARADFKFPSGAGIFLSAGGYRNKGRVEIAGPCGIKNAKGEIKTARDLVAYGENQRVSITVSMSKSAEQIAKDIKGRMMAQVEVIYAKMVEGMAKQDAYIAAKESLENQFSTRIKAVQGGKIYVSDCNFSGNTISPKLYGLSADQFDKILKVLEG